MKQKTILLLATCLVFTLFLSSVSAGFRYGLQSPDYQPKTTAENKIIPSEQPSPQQQSPYSPKKTPQTRSAQTFTSYFPETFTPYFQGSFTHYFQGSFTPYFPETFTPYFQESFQSYF